ncbi:MAG: hypothetical protein ACSLFR_17825 [Solirubrobacteraceae bacterium]
MPVRRLALSTLTFAAAGAAVSSASGPVAAAAASASPKVTIVAQTSSAPAGARVLVSARVLNAHRCTLSLRTWSSSRRVLLPAVDVDERAQFATWRWTVSKAAPTRGALRVNVTCRSSKAQVTTSASVINLTGDGSATYGPARDIDTDATAGPPERRPAGRAAPPCPDGATVLSSGYCPGSAASLVASRVHKFSNLGELSGWPAATVQLPAAKTGAVAWWKPSASAPRGHVALIDRLRDRWIWIYERDVYTPSGDDRARVPARGEGAPDMVLEPKPPPRMPRMPHGECHDDGQGGLICP